MELDNLHPTFIETVCAMISKADIIKEICFIDGTKVSSGQFLMKKDYIYILASDEAIYPVSSILKIRTV